MIAPRWVKTITQPIGVNEVLEYLVEAAKIPGKKNLIVDIGAEKISFRDMMLEAAEAFGLKRFIIPLPFFSPKLSSYWLVLVTPVPFPVASALIEGLKYETILLNRNAVKYFPAIKPLPYRETFAQAVTEIENDQVISRWCDTAAGVCFIRDVSEVSRAALTEQARAGIKEIPVRYIFQRVLTIGGERGWFSMNPLWKLRGFADKLAGGPGLARGRREKKSLRPGDALDFWKVVEIIENKRLLLLSQMRLPGRAWLEFTIQNGIFATTAYFIPRGIWGRIYWYLMYPAHKIMFPKITKSILNEALKDYTNDLNKVQ
jgi:hypothetical protein